MPAPTATTMRKPAGSAEPSAGGKAPAGQAAPAPAPAPRLEREVSPLGELTRLTYRTMRVMSAIGAQPGLSNIEVALRAGISDQGQISRLLSRLAGLGLLQNTGEGQIRGAANAWQLTAKGRRAQLAMTRELTAARRP